MVILFKLMQQAFWDIMVNMLKSLLISYDGHRSPCLQEVFDLLVKKYSYEDIHTLMYENPLHIINNEEVDPIEGKTSFFKKIFKRR